MNRQINYIVNAHIILIALAGTFFFIKNIPVLDTKENSRIENQSPDLKLSDNAQYGKTLFMSKCAACHALFKNLTGPGLFGFEKRGPWTDRKNVYDWIRNPEAFMARNEYAKNLKETFGGTMMTAFPTLTNEEIDAICD
ncbi:MAG TPA: cytochrome c [Chitinophagaceae bacterium]